MKIKWLFQWGVILASSAPMPLLAVKGSETYQAVCAVCHGPGLNGAPKLGDKAQWAPLIKEPPAQLIGHGYVGVRAMPPKGGKPDLSVSDFANAVVYMVNQAGGKWTEPNEKMLIQINNEIKKREASIGSSKKP